MRNRLIKVFIMLFGTMAVLFGLTACKGGVGLSGCDFFEHYHSYKYEVVEEKYLKETASCLNKATYYKSCVCGEPGEETFEYGEVLGHSRVKGSISINNVMYEVEECKNCDSVILYQNGIILDGCTGTVPEGGVVHPHDFVLREWGIEPTCTEQGVVAWFECLKCGKNIKETENALGHNVPQENRIIIEEASCTSYGWWEGVCLRCGETVEDIISKKAHPWNKGEVLTNATCTEEGKKLYTCTVCGATETRSINKIGHAWGEWIETKTPNCTQTGEQMRTCGVCGETETDILPIRHVWGDWVVTLEETCTTNGEETKTCQRCGETVMRVIAARHIFKDWYVVEEPTCTKDGKKESICSRCENAKDTRSIDDLGHDCQEISRQEPTCMEDGYIEYKCSRCDYGYREILPKAHKWTDGVCEHCGKTYCEVYGHDVKEFFNDEQHWRGCSRCDYIEKEKENHILQVEHRKTENNTGMQVIYSHSLYEVCEVCDYEYKIGETVTHVHYEAKIKEGKKPTCLEDGYTASLVCAVSGCGDVLVETEVVPALGHNYVDGVCTRCGEGKISEGLKYELLENDTYAVVGIGTCTDMDLVIPSTYNGKAVTSIGDYAFQNCYQRTSITIGDNIANIGEQPFLNCYSLTGVYITDIEAWCNIEFWGLYSNALFYAENLYLNDSLVTELVIPNTVTEIKACVFSYCYSLTSVVIPDSVTSISEEAFNSCYSLTDVVIGDSVTSIGRQAFDATGYYNNEENWENDVLYIGKYLIEAKETIEGEYIIKEGTLCIADVAFADCRSLTNVGICDSVTSIGESAFLNCYSLTGVYITDIAAWCNIEFERDYNSNPLEYAKNLYLNDSLVTELVIPNTVTEIKAYAFYNCDSLTSVIIDDSVTNIGERAFFDCRSLTNVEIGDSVTSIGDYAFYNCYQMTSVEIPNSVTSIGDSAFHNCDGLEIVVIGDNVTSIGGGAFCSDFGGNLTSVYITDIVAWCNIEFESSDSNPLKSAKNLYLNDSLVTELVIPNTVMEIKAYVFYSCDSLTSIEILDSVTSIDVWAFSSCVSLTSVVIGDSVTSIGDSAFEDCINLTSVVIPDSVTSIGESTFENCKSLTNVVISDCVKFIGYWAFEDCDSLTSVYYKGTAEEWEEIGINPTANDKLKNATRYYYSETEPTADGNWWHYVDGVVTVWE